RWRGSSSRWAPARSARASAVLEDDAFEHVGDRLARIGGRLEQVEDLFPLDDRDGVALLAEELRDSLAVEEVGLVLEGVDLADVLGHAGALLQRLDGEAELVGLL